MFRKLKSFVKSGYVGFENYKLDVIKEYVNKKFCDKRKSYGKVSDMNLKQWALKCAKKLEYSDFKASDSFVLKFKKSFHISGRKITKYVTKNVPKMKNLF